jgi:hypothetical protein
MSWKDLPKPDEVGDITESGDRFEVSISIPSDEGGYFGRECPFAEHGDVDLVELAGHERWQRLKRTFARRHVLTGQRRHRRREVPHPGARQRAEARPAPRVHRADAAQALDDLQAVVHALAGV